jgi:hypothetical protein
MTGLIGVPQGVPAKTSYRPQAAATRIETDWTEFVLLALASQGDRLKPPERLFEKPKRVSNYTYGVG